MKYFDYAATTPTSENALKEYIEVSRKYYANPGSSSEVRLYEQELKNRILDCLKLDNYEIIFTSGGTESNNLAIKGIVKKYHKKNSHFITSEFEHASVYEVFQKLSQGNNVSYLKVTNDGTIDINDFKKNLTAKTAFVCVMSVNNELGTIQPIEQLYKIAKEHNKDIIFMVDHIQGLSKMPNLTVEPDIITISSHKIYGPKAVGAVIIKKGLKLDKIILGGNKESNQRGGTQSLPAQAGFTRAICDAVKDLDTNLKKLEELRNYSYKLIDDRDYINLNIKSDTNVISISINDTKENSFYLQQLYENGFLLSSKSADSGMNKDYSRTLKAIGLSPERASKTLRLSISHHTSKQDLDELFNQLDSIYNK